jgi:hypothetical protein
VRAAFAHAGWAPGEKLAPGRAGAPYSWLHDPDVAWVIGVHDYEGVRYFSKELFERLLWWMALRELLAVAAQEEPGPGRIRALEKELASRLRAAADASYQVEGLFAAGRGPGA